MNSRSKLNCQALYTFNQFCGHSAIAGSTLLYVTLSHRLSFKLIGLTG